MNLCILGAVVMMPESCAASPSQRHNLSHPDLRAQSCNAAVQGAEQVRIYFYISCKKESVKNYV